MASSALRSLPLRFSIPWEVLLGICEQSDESTLRNLCLVSFGMLELAGPVLFHSVEIATPERLYSFFITPSLIPSSSRLRTPLGLHRLRNLRLNFEDITDIAQLDALIPLSAWSIPDLRLKTSSPLPLELDLVFVRSSSRSIHQQILRDRVWHHMIPAFQPRTKIFARCESEPSPDPTPQRVDLTLTLTSTHPRRSLSNRWRGFQLLSTDRVVKSIITQVPTKGWNRLNFVLSLRRVVLPSAQEIGIIEGATRALLDAGEAWKASLEVDLEVVVSSRELKQVLEKVVEERGGEDAKGRYRVVL